jgi:nicotinate dehydrogenase subunit B
MNKVEIGQGIRTAIAQIVAEELDVSMDRIAVSPADTNANFEGASTTGSNSIQGLGRVVRQASADIRSHLVGIAAAEGARILTS